MCMYVYMVECMYFYLPYVATAQCGTGACVRASTLFSVINGIPSRINFGANETVFMHSFTRMYGKFSRSFTQTVASLVRRFYAKTQIYKPDVSAREERNFCCYLKKGLYLEKFVEMKIDQFNQCKRKIFSWSAGFTIRASEDETSHDSLSCENL